MLSQTLYFPSPSERLSCRHPPAVRHSALPGNFMGRLFGIAPEYMAEYVDMIVPHRLIFCIGALAPDALLHQNPRLYTLDSGGDGGGSGGRPAAPDCVINVSTSMNFPFVVLPPSPPHTYQLLPNAHPTIHPQPPTITVICH